MCGICGFNWEDKPLLQEMVKEIRHRGPDAHGLYTDQKVSLGHARLSIIDLSEKGKNPIYNETGDICIIFNGEIYNYRELRKELLDKGHKFSSDTDTEVIVHLYEEYGTECLQKLNGMFAFCVYDQKNKKLFLARDRIGIKPLYYYLNEGKFIFASEIKAILKADIKREVSKEALRDFFYYRYTQRQTLFKHIRKVDPGQYLILDMQKNNIIAKRYWDIEDFEKTDMDISHIQAKLRELMEDSVKKRMRADVPVGVFLSGGIDSSIIAALAKQHTEKLNTFSVGFETTNELSHAKTVAEHIGSEHHQIHVGESEIDQIDNIVYHMDEPIGDAAFVPVFFLAKFTKPRATVVLAGEGADEIFTGYNRYKMLHFADKFQKIIPNLPFKTKSQIVERFMKVKNAQTHHQKHTEMFRLFDDEEFKELGLQKPEKEFVPKGNEILDQVQYFDMKSLIPNDFCMKADKMTSAHAVEERVPFLDHRIVEFGFKIPTKFKLGNYQGKLILKQTFKDILPRQIINRPKHGFDAPMDHWFKGPLKERLGGLLDERDHGHYNKEYVKKLLDKFQTAGTNYKENFFNAQKLWSVLMFELWHERFINK